MRSRSRYLQQSHTQNKTSLESVSRGFLRPVPSRCNLFYFISFVSLKKHKNLPKKNNPFSKTFFTLLSLTHKHTHRFSTPQQIILNSPHQIPIPVPCSSINKSLPPLLFITTPSQTLHHPLPPLNNQITSLHSKIINKLFVRFQAPPHLV